MHASCDTAMRSVAQVIKRFHISNQQWARLEDSQLANHVVLQVGWSDSALDSIGDPKEILQLSATGLEVPAQTPVAGVTWEGFHRSDSDELYHATWEHSTGQLDLKLPFAATCLGVNPDLHRKPGDLLHPDEQHWVVRVRALRQDFLKALPQKQQE